MKNLALYFAQRYLFSKKSINAIHVISGISMLGVLVSSAALVSILSFYNGLETLILSQFNSVISEIRIEPEKGKKIDWSDEDQVRWQSFRQDARVARFSETLEGQVLVQRDNEQIVAYLKGVAPDYLDWWSHDTLLFNKNFLLQEDGHPFAIVGAKVDYVLNVPYQREYANISIFTPRSDIVNSMNPAEEFNVMNIQVAGVMGHHEKLDETVLVPMFFAQELLDVQEHISAIEVDLAPGVVVRDFIKEYEAKLGPNLRWMTHEQQNSSLYKIIESEKWAIFAILTFTGFIAILNIIASLTMLVIDKRKDIAVLKGFGATPVLIRRIFFYQGMLISLAGCIMGLVIGFLLAWSQDKWGWLRFNASENLLVEAYPVDIRASDFILVFFTVLLVSVVISNIASRLSLRQHVRLS